MVNKPCERCGSDSGRRYQVQRPVYYKVNGWIGDQWVPYEKRIRTFTDKVRSLCEGCWQMEYNGGSVEAGRAKARELALIKGVISPVKKVHHWHTTVLRKARR